MESGMTSTGIQGNVGRGAGKRAEAPEARKCKSVKCAKSKQNPEVRRPGRYQSYHRSKARKDNSYPNGVPGVVRSLSRG